MINLCGERLASRNAFSISRLTLALLAGTLGLSAAASAQPHEPIRELRTPIDQPRLQIRPEIELRNEITEHNIRTLDGTQRLVEEIRGGPVALDVDRTRGVVERFLVAPERGKAPPDMEPDAAKAFVAVLEARPVEREPNKVMLALSPEEMQWSEALLESGAIALGQTGRIDDGLLDALVAVALGGASRDDLLTRFVLTGGKGIDLAGRLNVNDDDILDRMQELLDRHALTEYGAADCIAKMKAGAAGMAGSVAASKATPIIPNLAPMTGLAPNHGRPGSNVILSGSGWPATQPADVAVVFTSNTGNTDLRATIVSWSPAQIKLLVPSGVGVGPVGFVMVPAETRGDPAGPAMASAIEQCMGARGSQMASRFANWVPPKVVVTPPGTQAGGINLYTGGPQINTVVANAVHKGDKVTLTGHEFLGGDRVEFQGVSKPAVFVNDTTLTALVAPVIGGPTSVHVRTSNADASNAVNVQMLPVLTSLSRVQAKVGETARAKGSGFHPNSVVTLDGVPMLTTFVSPGEAGFTVQAQNVPVAGTPMLAMIRNPDGATAGPLPFKVLPPPLPPLSGWVDLHTHPMIHLAFGGKLVHGAPDVGSLLPTDVNCVNKVRVTKIEQALSDDSPSHLGYDAFVKPCGDHIRNFVIHEFQTQNHALATGGYAKGYPNFEEWPKWNDITHQKMWFEWVQRAHAGGLRVMVALATNNKTLADGVSGPGDGPTKNKESADLQITEIKDFVVRNKSFMEVALKPADVERIVRAGKMAVILGVEIDDIGNFNSQPFDTMNHDTVQSLIAGEIQRLRTAGVRYMFPVHVIDNWFGSTAVYTSGFNTSNHRESGRFWNIECAPASDNITFQYMEDSDFFMRVAQDIASAVKIGIDPTIHSGPGPVCPPTPQTVPPKGSGHRNARSPSWMHEFAIREMMRQGMFIDIDHSSQQTVDATLAIAEIYNYPIMSGHSGIRGLAGGDAENSRTPLQLNRIARLHGMFGLGTDGAHAYDWARLYQQAVSAMGYMNPDPLKANYRPGAVSLGTDLNGLVRGPMPGNDGPGANDKNNVVYSANTFPISKTGNKEWDYNTEGVAHYGMLWDFLVHVRHAPSNGYYSEVANANLVDKHVFASADYFWQTWKQIEAKKAGVPK